MQKKLSPLSWKLKLVLAYVYLILVGNIITVLVYVFIPDQELNLDNPVFERLATIISCTIIAVLAAWTVFCIRTRSNQSTFAYVMLTIVSYGIYANVYSWSNSPTQSLEGNIASATLFIIDAGIAVFLFKSGDVKDQLKRS